MQTRNVAPRVLGISSLLLGLVCGPAAAEDAGQTRGASAERPNILLILADDLGIGDLSCYGAEDLQSPHLDKLAGIGVRFTNFYANASVCSPTRASLLTGRYPDLVGVPGVVRTNPVHNWGYFDPNATTIADALSSAGYHTALVGKWHLGLEAPNTPNLRGFQHFHGFLGDMMDDYWHHRRTGVNYLRLNEEEIDPEGHATTLFTDWAIQYLRDRSGADEPFFLYLAYTAPHTPIQPPQEFLDKVLEREEGIDEKRAKLVALVEHLDHELGRVFRSLYDLGLQRKTIVIFTSDNGGALHAGANNGSYRGSKGSLWEGGLRVPCIASCPGRIPWGVESETVALTMDLFPTVCELAQAPVEGEIDGVSIAPSLQGETQEFKRDLVWTRLEGNNAMGRRTYAIRRGNLKIVQPGPFSEYELYHLGEDAAEEENIRKKLKKKFWAMIKSLQSHIQTSGAVPWIRPAS